jgi:hypothetical protein
MQDMKSILTLIIVLLLIAGAGYYVFQNNRSTQNVIPSPAPTQTVQSTPTQAGSATTGDFCTPSQLDANLEPEVAAGNLYAQITLKNNSQTTCRIVGNNTLKVGYPVSVTNFQTVIKSRPTTPVFTLTPNQTIYALIHYPNGPQCSSEATTVNAMVSYTISPTDSVSFKPTSGTTLDIPSCGNASEITTIDLYSFSNTEVTP